MPLMYPMPHMWLACSRLKDLLIVDNLVVLLDLPEVSHHLALLVVLDHHGVRELLELTPRVLPAPGPKMRREEVSILGLQSSKDAITAAGSIITGANAMHTRNALIH